MLLNCFAGCETEAVVAALGLELADLYDGASRANGRKATDRREAPKFNRTDYGNAERLVAQYGCDLRHVPGIGWLTWAGGRWQRDADGAVERRAKWTVRSIYGEAERSDDPDEREELGKWAARSESGPRISAMIELAARRPRSSPAPTSSTLTRSC